ncbi:MAG: DUF1499 domain-containing protein [Betaproteobacteria bacterium]|nr:DUF1499 domain-containing protein [Betaproteobacteria bacterium]
MGFLSGRRPDDLGVRGGRLKPVPATPNAVSSQARTAPHAIEPFTYEGPRQEALDVLLAIVRAFPGARVITQRDDYLYAEFATPVLGFVDDVEFYLPENRSLVHVRSASRLGYSDFGANRRRVERLRKLFARRGN